MGKVGKGIRRVMNIKKSDVSRILDQATAGKGADSVCIAEMMVLMTCMDRSGLENSLGCRKERVGLERCMRRAPQERNLRNSVRKTLMFQLLKMKSF